MTIAELQFPLYESVILTEQMPAHRVPQFLDENPEFKAWYLARRGPVAPPQPELLREPERF